MATMKTKEKEEEVMGEEEEKKKYRNMALSNIKLNIQSGIIILPTQGLNL